MNMLASSLSTLVPSLVETQVKCSGSTSRRPVRAVKLPSAAAQLLTFPFPEGRETGLHTTPQETGSWVPHYGHRKQEAGSRTLCYGKRAFRASCHRKRETGLHILWTVYWIFFKKHLKCIASNRSRIMVKKWYLCVCVLRKVQAQETPSCRFGLLFHK